MTVAAKEKKHSKSTRSVNPKLAQTDYPIVHFNSSQTDSVSSGPDGGWSSSSPASESLIQAAGPVSILTFTTDQPDFFWQVSTDKVSYLQRTGNSFEELARYDALYWAAEGGDDEYNFQIIPDEELETFGNETVDETTDEASMAHTLETYFGEYYVERLELGNGLYAVVDLEGTLYVQYDRTLWGFRKPGSGSLEPTFELKDAANVITGEVQNILGLAMTYDGYLVVTLGSGVAVIDRNLDPSSIEYYPLENERITNSVAVDEDGIYVVSSSTDENSIDGYLRRVVWREDGDDSILSSEVEGGWKSSYLLSVGDPPAIKFGRGSGSTPTLMDVGEDKLVVITDGQQVMHLLAFWREDGTPAGDIEVTCGLRTNGNTWIQSEQSVVVSGDGALVVNNMPTEEDLQQCSYEGNSMIQLMLVGPSYPGPRGAQRFRWTNELTNGVEGTWTSVWSDSEVPATSMVPIHCGSEGSGLAIICGYDDDQDVRTWQLNAFDWVSGEKVGTIDLGPENFGNGAYSLPQFLDANTLIFNSVAGPRLITF